MKLPFLIGFLVLILPALRAQTTVTQKDFVDSVPVNLPVFNKERLQLNKNAFIVLSFWGVANVLSGAIWQTRTNGTTKYFHQMDVAFGSVNLALGAASLWSLSRKRTDPDLAGLLKAQANVEKIFLFNAGIDLAYMVGGLYTFEQSNNTSDLDKQTKYKGWGQSLMMQGGFLLFFDLTMFLVQNHHGRKLYRAFGSPRISPQSAAFNWNL